MKRRQNVFINPSEPSQNFKTKVPLSRGREEWKWDLRAWHEGLLERTRFPSWLCIVWASQGLEPARSLLQPKMTVGPSAMEEILLNPLFTKSSRIWLFCLEITELVFELLKGLLFASSVSSYIPVLLNTSYMLAAPRCTPSPGNPRLACPATITDISRTTCSKVTPSGISSMSLPQPFHVNKDTTSHSFANAQNGGVSSFPCLT